MSGTKGYLVAEKATEDVTIYLIKVGSKDEAAILRLNNTIAALELESEERMLE